MVQRDNVVAPLGCRRKRIDVQANRKRPQPGLFQLDGRSGDDKSTFFAIKLERLEFVVQDDQIANDLSL